MTTLREDEPILLPAADDAPAAIADAIAVAVVNRASYRELLEAIGVAVYTTDANGVITDYNEAAVELWGRRPDVGKDEWCGSWRLFNADGTPLPHSECPMAVCLKQNRPVRGAEAIAERPDGSRFWFVPYPTPLRDPAGELIGAVNVMVDITARKNAELALRENEERLTEALAIKDEFLSLVSHELKTPITMILGNAKILARASSLLSEDDRAGALDDIARQSGRLSSIIDNLLVLARVESGQRIEYEPLMISRLVSDAMTDAARDYPQRNFGFSSNNAGACVVGDRTYVHQVMNNLLSNAVKYGADDAPIDVQLDADDECVTVRVLDRGPGIADGDRERIFESFYRSPGTARISGVGVGLTVCKRLVEAMDGAVSATNRPGGGADMSFTLPALTPDDD